MPGKKAPEPAPEPDPDPAPDPAQDPAQENQPQTRRQTCLDISKHVCADPKCNKLCDSKPHDNTTINSSLTPVVWVFGAPSSGKSTQTVNIASKYKFSIVNPTMILNEAAKNPEYNTIIGPAMRDNVLVPSEFVAKLLREVMLPKINTFKGFVVDGYPRDTKQITAFHIVAAVKAILYMEVPDDQLTERFTSVDRNKYKSAEVIKEKVEKFQKNLSEMLPLCAHLIRIDATKPIEEVTAEVYKMLDPILIKHDYV